MFKNYFKAAWENLVNNKIYSEYNAGVREGVIRNNKH